MVAQHLHFDVARVCEIALQHHASIAESGLRLTQVQVEMRERQAGTSSITFVRSLYYIVKVMLALLVASLRRYPRLGIAFEASGGHS